MGVKVYDEDGDLQNVMSNATIIPGVRWSDNSVKDVEVEVDDGGIVLRAYNPKRDKIKRRFLSIATLVDILDGNGLAEDILKDIPETPEEARRGSDD